MGRAGEEAGGEGKFTPCEMDWKHTVYTFPFSLELSKLRHKRLAQIAVAISQMSARYAWRNAV
jgi:hypothetical protein